VWTGALLDGVTAAALGLMAGVTVQLAGDAFVDPSAVALAVVAGILLWRTRLNTAWLVLGGAALGLGAEALGWVPA
jgi:chromate transporter